MPGLLYSQSQDWVRKSIYPQADSGKSKIYNWMCEGYWETCKCEDCKKVKELFSDLSFYWDNEEEREEIERTIESMGYSI